MDACSGVNSDYDADGHRTFDERLQRDSRGREVFLGELKSLRGSYRYREQLTDKNIRLLSLGPGEDYSPLECQLEVFNLDSAPAFEALSYTWGNSEPHAYIKLHHYHPSQHRHSLHRHSLPRHSLPRHSLQVTRNLKLALAYLRQKDKTRLLWIDAICIDQENYAEKAVQVNIMHDIYKRSMRTIVWVGESPPPFHKTEAFNLRAFDLCERIENSLANVKAGYTTISTENPGSRFWTDKLRERAKSARTKDDLYSYSESDQLQIYIEALDLACENAEVRVVAGASQPVSSPPKQLPIEGQRQSEVTIGPGMPWYARQNEVLEVEILSLKHLLNRPWFRRVWALQEVAVPQRVVLQCGPAIMDWRSLTIACFVLYRATALSRFSALLVNVDLSNVLHISILRNLVQRRNEKKLPTEMQKELQIDSLVKRYRTWNATDPKDKIYALLGLSSSRIMNFEIDYHRTTEDTYRAFATALLRTSSRMDLWTGLKGHSKLSEKLPFWAPDWSDTTPQLDLLFNAETMSYFGKESSKGTYFTASGTKPNVPIAVTADWKFIAAGRAIGEITELGNVLNSSKQDLECRWIAFGESDAKGLTESIKSIFEVLTTLKQWGRIIRASGKSGYYRTNEKIEAVHRKLLNLDLVSTGSTEKVANLAFDTWLGWLRTVHGTLKGLDTLGANLCDAVTGKPLRWKAVEEMMQKLEKRFFDETGGYASALRLVHQESYAGKLYYATGAMLKVAKGSWFDRGRKELNLALVINNPFAVSLEHINQRRLARTDTDFLALVPKEAKTGDHVVLLDGGAVPFIARTFGDRRTFLGSAYVHGAMYGEQWDGEKCESMEFI